MIVAGLKRSGNHAIMNWLLKSSGKSYLALNNLSHRDFYLSLYNQFPLNSSRCWSNVDYKDQYADFMRKSATDFLRKQERELILISFEDHMVDNFGESFMDAKEDFVGSSGKVYFVIVLRDIFNTVASITKMHGGNYKNMRWYLENWKSWAEEFLRITQHISNPVCINYNAWVSNPEYRSNIASLFGFLSNEESISDVSNIGEGSSFDGVKYHGTAQKMKVLERWKHYMRDHAYRDVFKDEALVDLSNRIFGPIPGTEVVLP